MAVTFPSSRTSHGAELSGMRQISSNLRFRALAPAPQVMTDSRRTRVGGPTRTAVSPARQDGSGDWSAASMPDSSPLPTAALVREAIDTALDSLDALEHQARDTARRFRRHAIDEGHQGLAHLVESTQTLLQLAVMTASASGTDVETVCVDHDLTVEGDTQAALSAMIGRQLEHDWHGLARVLERPFTRALDGWRALFLALDGSSGPYGHAA